MWNSYQALPILPFYILLAFFLTAHRCRILYTRYKSLTCQSTTRLHLALFTLLAIICLGSTWYYMFSFFAHSYHDWACQNGVAGDKVDAQKLEMWLRGTKLFEQAWNTVIETPQRFWWSQQIFFWTTGWSLFLGVTSRHCNISSPWTYMLLAQLVASSFAQNLFLLEVLLARSSTNQVDLATSRTPSNLLEIGPIAISVLCSAIVSHVANTSYFMPILLIPHLLLFIPATLPLPSQRPGTIRSSSIPTTRRYITYFEYIFAISFILLAASTYDALIHVPSAPLRRANNSCAQYVPQAAVSAPWRRLLGAIDEHPAVSSVSWDVILCLVTFIAWGAVNGFNPRLMLSEKAALERRKNFR